MAKIKIVDVPAGDFLQDSILNFGGYVNNHRHMVRLLSGFKPSYEKTIFTTLGYTKDRMIKVGTIIGDVAGKYSPHAPDALAGVVSELVHLGILDGQGAHGSSHVYSKFHIASAAPRYIEARINADWRKMIKLRRPLVKHYEAEMRYAMPY